MKVIAKHSRLPRKSPPAAVEPEPEKETDTTAKRVPAEKRALILEDAKALLLDGVKPKRIARKHRVSERALQTWILGSDDNELLKAWVDNGQAEADERLEKIAATSPTAHIEIAKVRELLKRRQWFAEKRDRARYGEEKYPVLQLQPILIITTAAEQPGLVVDGQKLLTEAK